MISTRDRPVYRADFRFWNILALARTADGFVLNNVWFDISGAVVLAADSPLEAEFVWTLCNCEVNDCMSASPRAMW
jgi:hypothetical protein